MASCSYLTIPERSKQQLLDLFSTSEVQLSQWCTVVPKGENSFKCTPSNSNKFYNLIPRCDEAVKTHLRESFKKVFGGNGIVRTFWEDFSFNITHKLGLTYREVQKMNGMKSYSEVKLQQGILNPILKEVSGAICIIPNMKGKTLKADFLIEDEIVLQDEKGGHKPAIDAVIQFSSKDDRVRAFVPIEMKLDLDTKQYSQIACYMNKVSTAEDIRGCIMVGILIDKKQFRLAFSVFCNKEGVPLPIVHISPPLQWRSEPESIISEESMLTLACTFLIGQVERIEYDPKEHLQDVTISPERLIELGELLSQSPHIFQKPIHENVLSLSRKVDEQQKALNVQREKIEEQEKEIKELKEKQKEIEERVFSKEKSIELQESEAGKPKCKIRKKYS